MGIDKQGKDRGRCKEVGCNCEDYTRPEKSAKCETCKHVPAKHELKGITRPPPGYTTCFHCQKFFSEEKHGMCFQCNRRPECKAGCGQPSFMDPQFGEFDYCSPECRDKDLIESGKAKENIQTTLTRLRDQYQRKSKKH